MNRILCLSCDNEVEPHVESRREDYTVRGEQVNVDARVAVCPLCGEDIDVAELDEATLLAAFDEYRSRHRLMKSVEMRALRKRYGLGVRAFSLLLGWGELTLHRYESGSLQDAAHETQLRMAENPANVCVMLEKNGSKLTSRQRSVLKERLAGESAGACTNEPAERFLVREEQDEYGGWRVQELSKLREMMLFFAALPGVYPTKLNKLLFYADFLHFKLHDSSISGTPYLAFQHGPVPQHYVRILADLSEGGDISREEVDFPDGCSGELLHAERIADLTIFTEEEAATLREVAGALGSLTSKQLREKSHSETAWSHTPTKSMISYEWARELSL